MNQAKPVVLVPEESIPEKDEYLFRSALFEAEAQSRRQDQLADKVREAGEALPQRQREFVLSFYFEGKSYTQVALRLGVTIKKAEKLHQEAKSRLRRLLIPLLHGSKYAET